PGLKRRNPLFSSWLFPLRAVQPLPVETARAEVAAEILQEVRSHALPVVFREIDELEADPRWERLRDKRSARRVPPRDAAARLHGNDVARQKEADAHLLPGRQRVGPFDEDPRQAEVDDEEVLAAAVGVGQRRLADQGNADPAQDGVGGGVIRGSHGLLHLRAGKDHASTAAGESQRTAPAFRARWPPSLTPYEALCLNPLVPLAVRPLRRLPRVGLTDSFKDATHPTLIVTGPPCDGTLMTLESPGAERVLGASPDAHLRLEADNVDAIHARVRWDASRGMLLTDVGSAAGTYVNGERVGAGHVLQDGDRVSLGPPGSRASVKLLVRLPRDLSAAAAPAASTEAPPFVLEDVAVTPYVAPAAAPAPPAAPAPVPAPPARAEPVVATPPTSPRAAVEPGAADAGASAAARPLPLVPPPGGERKRPVADYSSDTPSIVTDRVREPGPREA